MSCLKVKADACVYYSFAEAARILGTSRQNVYQRCKRGSMPYIKDENGGGVPEAWVQETLAMRSRNIGKVDAK